MIIKRVTNSDGSPYGFRVDCPGCKAFGDAHPGPFTHGPEHMIPVQPHRADGWGWNGSETAPTFSPSILIHEVKAGPNALVPEGTVLQPRCHSFIVNGKWQFLSDCMHPLAGQTVDMLAL